MRAESLEWIILRWLPPEKEMKTTHEMLWTDEKNSHNQNNYERMTSSLNWESSREGTRFRGNTSSVFKSENDDEKHHQELFRHSGRIKSEEVEPTMKRIWPILEKYIWLMIIHSYVKLGEEFESNSGKIEESGKILGKTCGLGPTRNIHHWTIWKRDCTCWIKWLERDNNLEISSMN